MKYLVAIFSVMVVTACGGGSSDNDEVNSSQDSSSVGIFTDSMVAGLEYTCGDKSGVTNVEGKFTCNNGDVVQFNIGNVILGSTVFSTLVSPIDLVEDGSTRNTSVQNISRFLQMLDKDGDLDNGIFISPEIREIARYWESIDFSNDLNIDSIVSDAASVDSTVHVLPDSTEASLHLEATLNITPSVYPGCSIVYPDTPFCNTSTKTTCNTRDISRSDIRSDMTYSQIVKIMGCHGELVEVARGTSAMTASYYWGTSSLYDWIMVFKESNGSADLYSATKY